MNKPNLLIRTALGASLALTSGNAFAQSAATDSAAPATADPATQEETAAPTRDIIVTAQKREQTLFEVPQSISVVGGETLERQQATSFVDYAALVPGLSLQQNTPGETRVVLRGINTGGASPTVAVYIDETPFGASTGQTNGAGLAGDIDPFDIARIEVLRGPQGTLYGANSLGGVLKFVTATPVLGKFEGRGQAGVEDTKGGGTGYSANGVLNVPLGDTIAIRASGYYRKLAGFIDTTGIARRNANEVESYGGRGSLLFEPTDALSARLTAIAQNIRADSRAAFDADPVTLKPLANDPITGEALGGRLTRTQYFPDRNNVDYRLYNGTASWDFGFANLTSITSYSTLKQREATDASFQLAGLGDAIFGDSGTPGPRGITLPSRVTQKKFTQELRLASSDSETFEWLIGGYYTREKGRIFQSYLPFALDTGELIDPSLTLPFGPGGADLTFPDFLVASLSSRYREYAGFGSATLHLSPRFEITAGGRYSHNKQRTVQVLDGSILPITGAPLGPDEQRGRSSENVFTWSIAPRFEISDRVAVYARAAKGYRPGGPNVVPPGAADDFPRQFESDTLISYEAGLRAETADRTFALDASVYYLDWKNIQVLVTYNTSIGPINADGNGDDARSVGAEVTATLRPTAGLSVVGSVAYNDAKLTDDLPEGNGGFDGDRLPYAPQLTANLSADYEWNLSNGAKAFVGGSVRLIGDQQTDFDANYLAVFGNRLEIDGYQVVDLRAGAELGPVNLTLFARNVFNSRGLTNADGFLSRPALTPPATALSASPIRPRTIGITAGFAF
jgi:outer membrane receptor protein involved in Fe transport